MKHITPLLFTLSLFLFSCEKAIDLQLNDNEQKIVIDAILTNEEGGCIVKLSQTKNFSTHHNFEGLSGAKINICNELGNIFWLQETEPGVYIHPTLKGNSNETYKLSVEVSGQNFTATSTMPQKVKLDSLRVVRQYFFDEEETFAHVEFADPIATKNYYRFKQFVNGKKLAGNYILDDEFNNGRQIKSTLYIFPEENDTIKVGDEITIEMQCIDKAVYKYWYSYEQAAAGASQSAAPANPVSNIVGGALGYFSAHTIEVQHIFVP